MILSAVMFSVSAIGCAFCVDFNQLVVYRIIGGVGIGVVSVVSPLYIFRSIGCAIQRTFGQFVSVGCHCRLFGCLLDELSIVGMVEQRCGSFR